jgi:hypothetical protein
LSYFSRTISQCKPNSTIITLFCIFTTLYTPLILHSPPPILPEFFPVFLKSELLLSFRNTFLIYSIPSLCKYMRLYFLYNLLINFQIVIKCVIVYKFVVQVAFRACKNR